MVNTNEVSYERLNRLTIKAGMIVSNMSSMKDIVPNHQNGEYYEKLVFKVTYVSESEIRFKPLNNPAKAFVLHMESKPTGFIFQGVEFGVMSYSKSILDYSDFFEDIDWKLINLVENI